MNPNLVNPDIVLNMNVIYRLIFIGIEIVVLGIGFVLFYQGRYLEAPEEKRLSIAKNIKRLGVWWLCVGFAYMVCWLLALVGIL